MSEELDVFAGAVPPKGGARQNGPAKPKQYRTFKKFNRAPAEPVAAEAAPAVNPNRNPDLPEYRLADIQTWPAPAIVERMMPGADPEELGSYRKHELIFAAIRSYLARGGAVLASGCLEIVREGHGFLRSAKNNFLACPEDVFVTQQQIRRHALRTGDIVEGPVRDPRDRDRFFCLGAVVSGATATASSASAPWSR